MYGINIATAVTKLVSGYAGIHLISRTRITSRYGNSYSSKVVMYIQRKLTIPLSKNFASIVDI